MYRCLDAWYAGAGTQNGKCKKGEGVAPRILPRHHEEGAGRACRVECGGEARQGGDRAER